MTGHGSGAGRLLIVKLGSSSVTQDAGPDRSILADALDQSIAAMRAGWRVILVSSGAQSVGRAVLDQEGIRGSSPKLAAAFGQPILMDFYRDRAAQDGVRVSQFLIGESDLRSQRRMAALAGVLRESLDLGVIPIVNGNDPADDGRTNNDLVAAGIAMMIRATHLLLLTDVDAVYDPQAGPVAELHVDDVHTIRSTGGGSGTGGIKAKLRAAEIAARNGVETRVASARDPRAIQSVVEGLPVGTLIRAARTDPGSGTRKWIAGGAIAQGALSINAEAERSISAGSSLFASGIKRVRGEFRPGDVVELLSPRDQLLGRGTVRLSSELLTLVRALRVDDIARVLIEVLRPGASRSRGASGPALAHAVAHLRDLNVETRRRLLVEVTALFPDDAAAALTGARRPRRHAALVAHYAHLVSGLAVIHNDYLVEFPVMKD